MLCFIIIRPIILYQSEENQVKDIQQYLLGIIMEIFEIKKKAIIFVNAKKILKN